MNISKSGTSWSVGPRGAKVNFGKRGTYVTTGIPGTGIYSRTKSVVMVYLIVECNQAILILDMRLKLHRMSFLGDMLCACNHIADLRCALLCIYISYYNRICIASIVG